MGNIQVLFPDEKKTLCAWWVAVVIGLYVGIYESNRKANLSGAYSLPPNRTVAKIEKDNHSILQTRKLVRHNLVSS